MLNLVEIVITSTLLYLSAKSHKIVMLVGHNHAFTALVNMLGDKNIDHVPTCGMTVIDFESDDWQKISRGTTRETIFPRDFK